MANSVKIILVAVGTVVIAGLGIVAYILAQPSHSIQSGVAYYPQGEPPPFRAPSIDGKRLYKSELLKFDVYYPDDLFIREYGEANTSTIVFEDEKGEKGFQIFVVPYEGETVSEERFKMDIPSGVIAESTTVKIGGVDAEAFYSMDAILGDTREVWFIKNGFLYEVTARKDLDSWLAGVMNTWEFI